MDAVLPLFGSLHPEMFRVLSGRLRWFYADLLEFIASDVFSEGGMIPRSDMIEYMRQFVSRSNWRCEGGQDADQDADFLAAPDMATRAQFAYRRLVDTGWLVEHRDAYRRFVDLDSNARFVLDLLLDIKSGRLRSYGGEVLQVMALLESARADPVARSEAVRNAARSTRSFLNHLRSVGSAMRKAEQALVGQRDFTSFIRKVFSDFIAKHLIEDFKRLHTQANPFRFRTRILELASEMEVDELLISQLGQSYANEGRAADLEEGRDVVMSELSHIQRVFNELDGYLAVIDETQRRVEKRLSNTVRFMDRISESGADKIASVIALLADSGLPDGAETPLPRSASPGSLPLGDENLYQPVARRQKAPRTPVRRTEVDPAIAAYNAAMEAYWMRGAVTPRRIVDYLEAHLRGKRRVAAKDLRIASLDDFFVFERLRSLEYIDGGSLSKHYVVEATDERVDNEWVTCRGFVISRRRPEGDSNGA
jgi:hypothetical protein